MTHGVIGNTSDFGSEESRFETWWVNNEFSQRDRLAPSLKLPTGQFFNAWSGSKPEMVPPSFINSGTTEN